MYHEPIHAAPAALATPHIGPLPPTSLRRRVFGTMLLFAFALVMAPVMLVLAFCYAAGARSQIFSQLGIAALAAADTIAEMTSYRY
jgi:sensor histidine kinase regulating citrate/malate metabolism